MDEKEQSDFENQEGNKAQRLHRILLEVSRKLKNPQNQYRKMIEPWSEVLHLEQSDVIGIYRNLGYLSENLIWTEKQLEEFSTRKKERYLRNFPKIAKVFNVSSLDANSQMLEKCLTPQALADLEHAAEDIADQFPENDIPVESINELIVEIEELSKLFLDSDLDVELRTVILDLLESSRGILSDYRIRGNDAIKEIIVRAVGELNLKRSECAKNKDDSNLKRFLGLISKADGFYAKATKYKPLLEMATQALPWIR